MQARAHRADRDLEDVRDLVIGEFLHEVERADHAILLRQLADRLRDALGAKAINERARRVLPLPRKPVLRRAGVEVEVRCVIEIDGGGSPLPATVVGPEASRENPKDPRLEVRSGFERRRRAYPNADGKTSTSST
jgi:hypothetical protein